MYQPAPDKSYTNPLVYINNIPLKSVQNFSYLESILSNLVNIDNEVRKWIARASSPLGILRRWLWDEHGAISVYTRLCFSTRFCMVAKYGQHIVAILGFSSISSNAACDPSAELNSRIKSPMSTCRTQHRKPGDQGTVSLEGARMLDGRLEKFQSNLLQ